MNMHALIFIIPLVHHLSTRAWCALQLAVLVGLTAISATGLGQFPDIDSTSFFDNVKEYYSDLYRKTQAANCLMMAIGVLMILNSVTFFIMICQKNDEDYQTFVVGWVSIPKVIAPSLFA